METADTDRLGTSSSVAGQQSRKGRTGRNNTQPPLYLMPSGVI